MQDDSENLQTYEQEDCQYISDFEQESNEFEADLDQQPKGEYISDSKSDSSVCVEYSGDRYDYEVYDQFANQNQPMITHDRIENYMFLADHNPHHLDMALSSSTEDRSGEGSEFEVDLDQQRESVQLFPEEDNLPFSDLQVLSNLQLEHVNHDPECVDVVAAYAMSSLQFLDVQTQGNSIKYEEEGEELKGPDQQSILHVSLTRVEQPTFNIEISEGNQQQFVSQLDQQRGEVFYHAFHDPMADFLESTNKVNVKISFVDESRFNHLFEPLSYMMWLPLLFESRSKMHVNHNLTWLHWKYDVT